MKYNFDEIVERRNTGCEKYDGMAPRFGTNDIIPLWVADMDFKVADVIVEAMQKQLNHSIFGYPHAQPSVYKAIISWVKRRNDWDIKPDWIAFCPGIVPGLSLSVQALTNADDKVVIQPPVYPPFFFVVKNNGRDLLENSLVEKDGYYTIDFNDLDAKLKGASLFIFCNPHNPVGRSWTREELLKVGELCVKHNVTIISDEIHADLHMPPHKHIHLALLSPEISDRTLTFIAASKSFNIAGLSLGMAVSSNPELLAKFKAATMRQFLDTNTFGLVALKAAYNEGEEWLGQLVDYVSTNADYVVSFLQKELPVLKARKQEATYLLWIDCRGLGLEQDELVSFVINEAGLALNSGVSFGEKEGKGFMRMNLACPCATIEKALQQLKAAVDKRFKR